MSLKLTPFKKILHVKQNDLELFNFTSVFPLHPDASRHALTCSEPLLWYDDIDLVVQPQLGSFGFNDPHVVDIWEKTHPPTTVGMEC